MNVAIIGTGAYGMALASVFYNNKCKIKMWTNSEEEKNILQNALKLGMQCLSEEEVNLNDY